MTHRRPEVEGTAAQVAPLAGEARLQLAGERLDRLADLDELLAARVHEVDVFGQRFAQRAGKRLDAAVGHEPAADLGLDLPAQLVDPRLVLVFEQPLLEWRQLPRRPPFSTGPPVASSASRACPPGCRRRLRR